MRKVPSSRCGASASAPSASPRAEFVIGQHARAGRQRVLDGDRRRSFRDVDAREPRGAAGRVARARDDREQRLAVEEDLLVGEQRLVGENGRDVVLAGNVGGGQHRNDAVGRAHRGKIEPAQRAARLVGHADGDMQRALRLANVVDDRPPRR